jgi:hypothetical protein
MVFCACALTDRVNAQRGLEILQKKEAEIRVSRRPMFRNICGSNPSFKPKFLRTYGSSFEIINAALDSYDDDVKGGKFPSEKESYS